MPRALLIALLLSALLTGAPARGADWTRLAADQGVEVSYQAVGNVARLRISNSNRTPASVAWTMQVQLGTGSSAERVGELDVAAGDTVVVATGPYTDAGHPAEVKSLSATIRVKTAGNP